MKLQQVKLEALNIPFKATKLALIGAVVWPNFCLFWWQSSFACPCFTQGPRQTFYHVQNARYCVICLTFVDMFVYAKTRSDHGFQKPAVVRSNNIDSFEEQFKCSLTNDITYAIFMLYYALTFHTLTNMYPICIMRTHLNSSRFKPCHEESWKHNSIRGKKQNSDNLNFVVGWGWGVK